MIPTQGMPLEAHFGRNGSAIEQIGVPSMKAISYRKEQSLVGVTGGVTRSPTNALIVYCINCVLGHFHTRILNIFDRSHGQKKKLILSLVYYISFIIQF